MRDAWRGDSRGIGAGIFRILDMNFLELRQREVRRIPLLSSTVNSLQAHDPLAAVVRIREGEQVPALAQSSHSVA
jgi:hypothetical protein